MHPLPDMEFLGYFAHWFLRGLYVRDDHVNNQMTNFWCQTLLFKGKDSQSTNFFTTVLFYAETIDWRFYIWKWD